MCARFWCDVRLQCGDSGSWTHPEFDPPFWCPSPLSGAHLPSPRNHGLRWGQEVTNSGRLSPSTEAMWARILVGRTGCARGASGPSTWPVVLQIRPILSPHYARHPGSAKKCPEHPTQPATLGLCSPPAAPTRCGFSGFSSPAFPSAIFPAAASLQPRQGRHGPAQ